MVPVLSRSSSRRRPVITGGGGGFVPTDVGGLVLWLRADTITGLSDGDPVSTWLDESGNGTDATSSSALRPTYQTSEINGLPVVRFDGTDDRISWSAISGRSFFVVYRPAGTQPAGSALWGHAGSTEHMFNFFSPADNTWCDNFFAPAAWQSGAWRKNGSSMTPTATNTLDINSWQYVSVVTTSGRTINQTEDNTTGAGRVPYGDIAEYFIYDNDIGGTAIAAAEAYLAGKYGL